MIMSKVGNLHQSLKKNSCTGVLELLYLALDNSRIGKTYYFFDLMRCKVLIKNIDTAKKEASKTRTTIKGEK